MLHRPISVSRSWNGRVFLQANDWICFFPHGSLGTRSALRPDRSPSWESDVSAGQNWRRFLAVRICYRCVNQTHLWKRRSREFSAENRAGGSNRCGFGRCPLCLAKSVVGLVLAVGRVIVMNKVSFQIRTGVLQNQHEIALR